MICGVRSDERKGEEKKEKFRKGKKDKEGKKIIKDEWRICNEEKKGEEKEELGNERDEKQSQTMKKRRIKKNNY